VQCLLQFAENLITKMPEPPHKEPVQLIIDSIDSMKQYSRAEKDMMQREFG